ncbi:HNH endonuclease [Planctomycetota bacterium]
MSMAFLPLTQGHVAIVDEEDLEYLQQWNWYINRYRSNLIYPIRKERISVGNWKPRKLHHEVLRLKVPLPKGKVIDHINHDTLDCRKGNLRVCSMSENNCNRRPWGKIMTSKYKGVTWQKRYQHWEVAISLNHKRQWLGHFKSEYDAVMAYNAAAIELHGSFAWLNHWDGPSEWKGDPADAPPGYEMALLDQPKNGRRRSPYDIEKPPGVQLQFDFM